MKKFDVKDVFRFGNAEKAKEYVGKLGYFGDSLEDIKKWVQKYPPDFLFQILGKDEKKRFMVDDPEVYIFKLFLPAIKVIEVGEPKKYRPFKSIDEFQKETGLDLLSIVHYRLSPSRSITSKGCGVITEFNTSGSDKTDYITIGDTSFNLDELFNYEYLDKQGEWLPFGVLEDD